MCRDVAHNEDELLGRFCNAFVKPSTFSTYGFYCTQSQSTPFTDCIRSLHPCQVWSMRSNPELPGNSVQAQPANTEHCQLMASLAVLCPWGFLIPASLGTTLAYWKRKALEEWNQKKGTDFDFQWRTKMENCQKWWLEDRNWAPSYSPHSITTLPFKCARTSGWFGTRISTGVGRTSYRGFDAGEGLCDIGDGPLLPTSSQNSRTRVCALVCSQQDLKDPMGQQRAVGCVAAGGRRLLKGKQGGTITLFKQELLHWLLFNRSNLYLPNLKIFCSYIFRKLEMFWKGSNSTKAGYGLFVWRILYTEGFSSRNVHVSGNASCFLIKSASFCFFLGLQNALCLFLPQMQQRKEHFPCVNRFGCSAEIKRTDSARPQLPINFSPTFQECKEFYRLI